ncbi:MAG: hypothetical protein WC101_03880 [Candidatus Gracilibacteria bacterium]
MDLASSTVADHEAVPTVETTAGTQKRNEVLIFDDNLERRVALAAQIREIRPEVIIHISSTRRDALNHAELDHKDIGVVIADASTGARSKGGHALQVAGTADIMGIPKIIVLADSTSLFTHIKNVKIIERALFTRESLEQLFLQQ